MAQSIKDLLEQNGIPAMMHSFQIPAYDGIAQVMRPSWGEVLVEEEDLERAKELVEGFLAEDSRLMQGYEGAGGSGRTVEPTDEAKGCGHAGESGNRQSGVEDSE